MTNEECINTLKEFCKSAVERTGDYWAFNNEFFFYSTGSVKVSWDLRGSALRDRIVKDTLEELVDSLPLIEELITKIVDQRELTQRINCKLIKNEG
jgi:hypothetical protein